VTAVGVLGAGPFGRALALAAARTGTDVLLWSRSLRGDDIERVTKTRSLTDIARAETIFLAVPSEYIEELADRLGRHLDGRHLLIHVSRGLVGDDLVPISRILRARTPSRRIGVLAGPLLTSALEEGTPSGAIVGSLFPEVGDAVREAIAGPSLRIYSTRDVIGVEVSSAMVGLLAVSAGLVRGLGIGPAALAVMITRGLAEAARIGMALGAEERTFSGLAGFGDALACAADDGRPEVALGRALAEGRTVDEAARAVGAHVESMTLAGRIAGFAARRGIEAPLSRALADVLSGHATVPDTIAQLMTRPSRKE
jgi:glycerol-3-phosphate dehydrogenase (NAD(P)+)